MKKDPLFLVGLIFLVVGLVFAAVAAGVGVAEHRFRRGGVEIAAVITEIVDISSGGEQTREVYVRFTADGEEIETETNFYSSAMREGDRLKVFYDPANPRRIMVNSFPILLLIFGLMGTVFAGLGGGLVIFTAARVRKQKRIVAQGRKVWADVVSAEMDLRYTYNHRHPYVLICRAWIEGQERQLRSGHIWSDPSWLVGRKIAVFYLRERPGDYAVDLSSEGVET